MINRLGIILPIIIESLVAGLVFEADDGDGVCHVGGDPGVLFDEEPPEDGPAQDDDEQGERRNEETPDAGGLFPGDMDRGAGLEDDPLGDGQAVFDPDEVGEDFVGGLIAISFFLLEAAEDQAISGSGTWALSLRGGMGARSYAYRPPIGESRPQMAPGP